MRFAIPILAVLIPTSAWAAPVVISNAAAGIQNAEQQEIQKVFLGKQKNLGSISAVQLLDIDEASGTKKAFLEKAIGMNPADFQKHWSRLIFTGKANPPKNVGDSAAIKAHVAKEKDAIGVIDETLVDATVKVIFK